MCYCFCVHLHLLLYTRAVQGLWWKGLGVTVNTCLFRPESAQFFKWIAWLTLKCPNKWKLNWYFLYYTAKSTKTIKSPLHFFPGCLYLVQKCEWHSSYPSVFLLKFDFAANCTVNFTMFLCMPEIIRNDLGCLVLWGLSVCSTGWHWADALCMLWVLQSTWSPVLRQWYS